MNKIAWCITGGEHFLKESTELIEAIGPSHIDIFLSKSGVELLVFYNLMDKLGKFSIKEEQNAPGFEIFGLFNGIYDKLVIAPCTSNTVAKMSLGIADTLCTNMFSQATKIGIQVIILPTDIKKISQFKGKSGRLYTVKRRKIDKMNIDRLSLFGNVSVVHSVKDLKSEIAL